MEELIKDGADLSCNSISTLTDERNPQTTAISDHASDYPDFKVVSGIGQYHSNEPTTRNPKPYLQVGLKEILQMVENPPSVPKKKSQWLIPSSLPSRKFNIQREQGQYWMLWADIDDPARWFSQYVGALEDLGCNYVIYTTKSATIGQLKVRMLLPLAKPLSGWDWLLAQECLSEYLYLCGINADHATHGSAQLCYLPNRGRFYQHDIELNKTWFDPCEYWGEAMVCREQEKKQAEQQAAQRKRQSEAKRSARVQTGFVSPITEFCDQFTVEEILEQADYDRKGSTFRHPNSQSGNYSASVKNGRVRSLSDSDPLYTTGAHDSFSAFCVLFHGGNKSQALKDACNNWIQIDGMSWNQYQGRRV